MELLIVGMLIGVAVTYFIWSKKQKKVKETRIQTQSTLLLEKIHSVCKLITVEGDFSEVYPHKEIKSKFFDLISSEKKALVLVNAKAYMGFDLQKMKLDVNAQKKEILITEFPLPELLSLVPEIRYYDKKEGWFNTFSLEDLNGIHQQAKQYIIDKIPQSGLHQATSEKAIETFAILAHLTQTIGWNLNYEIISKQLNDKRIIENFSSTAKISDTIASVDKNLSD